MYSFTAKKYYIWLSGPFQVRAENRDLMCGNDKYIPLLPLYRLIMITHMNHYQDSPRLLCNIMYKSFHDVYYIAEHAMSRKCGGWPRIARKRKVRVVNVCRLVHIHTNTCDMMA